MTAKRIKSPDRQVRGVVHEYWLDRAARRKAARQQALGRVGPQGRKGANCITQSHTSQEKKENKLLDPWA